VKWSLQRRLDLVDAPGTPELQMKIALGKFKVSRNSRADVFRNEKKKRTRQGEAKMVDALGHRRPRKLY
jgi:hypothetical protein